MRLPVTNRHDIGQPAGRVLPHPDIKFMGNRHQIHGKHELEKTCRAVLCKVDVLYLPVLFFDFLYFFSLPSYSTYTFCLSSFELIFLFESAASPTLLHIVKRNTLLSLSQQVKCPFLKIILLYLTCHSASHSSEESAKAKTQKEVIKTLKELKLHLPAEKRHGNKSTTLSTLKYALRCVKQVEGKEF